MSISLLAPAIVAIATLMQFGQQTASCGTNIVSSTVVATYCDHRSGDGVILDLMILWRGTPGWFQRNVWGTGGGGGGDITRYTTKGRINRWSTYGDVTIGFDADFDANTVKIGDEVLPLESVNAVFVDGVDGTGARRIRAARWIEPRLPIAPDMNVVVIQRSRELRDFLQCDVPMPAPPATPVPRPPMRIITVCEKLKAK